MCCTLVEGRADGADRTGIAAGSPIPIELMKSLIDKLNLVDLTNAYGMSASIGPPSFMLCLSDECYARQRRRGAYTSILLDLGRRW